MFEFDNNLLEYTVSTDGIIKNISGGWDSFAIDNDAYSLFSETVIGTNLFSHISGDSVKHIYQILHERALNTPGHPVTFSYRCDSPGERRTMTMIIVARGSEIVYRSMVVNSRRHRQVMDIDYTAVADKLILMCSWCKRFNMSDEQTHWQTFETIFDHLDNPFTITHGICPECRDKLESESMRSVWQKSSEY